MRRHLIGILGLLLLLGVLVTWNWEPDSAWGTQIRAGCWRLGPLLIILWLAFPQVERVPAWLWVYIIIVLVLAAWKPKLLLIAIPIIVVLAVLKPRFGRRKRPE